MTTYRPRPGVWVARPPCDECGASFHLHRPPAELEEPPRGPNERRMITGQGLGKLHDMGVPLQCPEAYRPTSIEEAEQALAAAEASGSEERVFIARGELQRLTGRKDLQSQG